jgi:hypothetical protein
MCCIIESIQYAQNHKKMNENHKNKELGIVLICVVFEKSRKIYMKKV